jgi:hypothetical protein
MSKLQLLKILFPSVFGYPRAAFQLSEVREMINIMKNNEFKIKDKKVTVTFDVSADIDGQNFNLDEHIKKLEASKVKYKELYWEDKK